MPIKKPGRVLLHKIPLKFVHDRVAGGGRKSVDASVVLVPFIDFLITLVVFLLTSFSATGELVAQKPSIKMPDAQNTTELELAPIIAIDAQVVTLNGTRVADTPSLIKSPDMERIEALIRDLETYKRKWAILHPTETFPSTVIVQSDQAVDVLAVKKIMFSTGQAGYTNLSFAVNKVGEGS